MIVDSLSSTKKKKNRRDPIEIQMLEECFLFSCMLLLSSSGLLAVVGCVSKFNQIISQFLFL
jgi:hypothetical protein